MDRKDAHILKFINYNQLHDYSIWKDYVRNEYCIYEIFLRFELEYVWTFRDCS